MHLHSVVLVEGSCPNVNDCLWGLIEKIDHVETKKRRKFRAVPRGEGMDKVQSPVLFVNGDEVESGFREIREYLKGVAGLSQAVGQCQAQVGGRVAVTTG